MWEEKGRVRSKKKQSTYRYGSLNFQITFIVSLRNSHFIQYMCVAVRVRERVCLFICKRIWCYWKLSKSKTCLCNLRLNVYSLWFNSVTLQQYYKRLWKMLFSIQTPSREKGFIFHLLIVIYVRLYTVSCFFLHSYVIFVAIIVVVMSVWIC